MISQEIQLRQQKNRLGLAEKFLRLVQQLRRVHNDDRNAQRQAVACQALSVALAECGNKLALHVRNVHHMEAMTYSSEQERAFARKVRVEENRRAEKWDAEVLAGYPQVELKKVE